MEYKAYSCAQVQRNHSDTFAQLDGVKNIILVWHSNQKPSENVTNIRIKYILKRLSQMCSRLPYSSGLSTSLPCCSPQCCLPITSGEEKTKLQDYKLIKQFLSHFRLVHSGATTFESNRRIHSYNLGWRQNWREVMGYNWRMALVWPGAKSKLPHNGVEWDTQNTWRLEAPKNR